MSEGLIFVYQQLHLRINKNQPWYRKATSLSLNTKAINVLYIERVEDNTYSLNYLYGRALTTEPLPRGHEIYNTGRPFHGHHYFILSLSDLCMGVEKIFKENVFSLYNLYGHTLVQEALPWGS